MSDLPFTAAHIAPCGMNCGVCSAYLAFTHNIPRKRGKITHCAGCRARNKKCGWLKGCCTQLANGVIEFCYECTDFPCDRLAHLDKRYRTCYDTSPIRNLEEIHDLGMEVFLEIQRERYTCRKCKQDVVSVHNGKCYACERVTTWKGKHREYKRGEE